MQSQNINFLDIIENWGIDDGSLFMKLLFAILKTKNIDKDMTFIDLHKKTNKLFL